LGFVEKGIGRFPVVLKAQAACGTGLTGGKERCEGGGVSGQLIGGLALHEGHRIGMVESGKFTIRISGLSQGEKFRAGTGDKKDDDAMSARTNKITDVAVREADEGQKNG
jgi:hypothetical protein